MYNRDIEKPRNFFLKTLKQKLELDKKDIDCRSKEQKYDCKRRIKNPYRNLILILVN